MNRQILVAFIILIFALAIAGYAYSRWQEIICIESTIETAEFGIYVQNYNATLNWQMSEDNHTLTLNSTIMLNQPILAEVTIKNNGTTPATITCQIITNNTDLWNTNFTYNQNPTPPYELQAEDTVVIQHNITLSKNPSESFAIEIILTYKAEFQSWTDEVTIIYTLTYEGEK